MKNYKKFVKELDKLEKERKRLTQEMIKIIHDKVKELGGEISLSWEDYNFLDEFSSQPSFPLMTFEFNYIHWSISSIFIDKENDIVLNVYDYDSGGDGEITLEEMNDSEILLEIIKFLEQLTPDIIEKLKIKKESEKFNL